MNRKEVFSGEKGAPRRRTASSLNSELAINVAGTCGHFPGRILAQRLEATMLHITMNRTIMGNGSDWIFNRNFYAPPYGGALETDNEGQVCSLDVETTIGKCPFGVLDSPA